MRGLESLKFAKQMAEFAMERLRDEIINDRINGMDYDYFKSNLAMCLHFLEVNEGDRLSDISLD